MDDELWNDPDYAGQTGAALRAWWTRPAPPLDLTVESEPVAAVVLLIIAGPLVGAAIGSAKGHTVGGFFLGLFLGPLGWLIALVMGPSRKMREQEYREWQADQP